MGFQIFFMIKKIFFLVITVSSSFDLYSQDNAISSEHKVILSILEKNYIKLDSLVRVGASVNSSLQYEEFNVSSLDIASLIGDTTAINFLLERKASVGIENTPMAFALLFGHLPAVKKLVQHNINFTGVANNPFLIITRQNPDCSVIVASEIYKSLQNNKLPDPELFGFYTVLEYVSECEQYFKEDIFDFILSTNYEITTTDIELLASFKEINSIVKIEESGKMPNLEEDCYLFDLLILSVEGNHISLFNNTLNKYNNFLKNSECDNNTYYSVLPLVIQLGKLNFFTSIKNYLDVNLLNQMDPQEIFRDIESTELNINHLYIFQQMNEMGYSFKTDIRKFDSHIEILCRNNSQSKYLLEIAEFFISKDSRNLSINKAIVEASKASNISLLKLLGGYNNGNYNYNDQEALLIAFINNRDESINFLLEKIDTIRIIYSLFDVADSEAEQKHLMKYCLKNQLITSNKIVNSYEELIKIQEDVVKSFQNQISQSASCLVEVQRNGQLIMRNFFRPNPHTVRKNDVLKTEMIKRSNSFSSELIVKGGPVNPKEGDLFVMKNGDKFYYNFTGNIEIPKISFNNNSQLVYPAYKLTVNYFTWDHDGKFHLDHSGRVFNLTDYESIILDGSFGSLKLNYSNIKGTQPNLLIKIDFNEPYNFSYKVKRSFTLKDRLLTYAVLYHNKFFYTDKRSIQSKNAITHNNIISQQAFLENYPTYTSSRLKELSKKLIDYNDNLIKLREFYFTHNELTIEVIPELKLMIELIINSDNVNDDLITKLEMLNAKIEQGHELAVTSNDFLDIFSSELFKSISQEVQLYQILILELAQFRSVEEIERDLNYNDNELLKMSMIIQPEEVLIEDLDLSGRGSNIKRIMGK